MAFIVNFEHISYIILQLILLNSNKKNDVWDWESVVSDSKFVSNNCEKYIDLRAGNIFLGCVFISLFS